MKIYRIHISSWTASFRYPNMISGYQATLPIPPLSTILGLISAAMGRLYFPDKLNFGYVFQTGGLAKDLEKIYQIRWDKTVKGRLKNITSNVIWREFLVDNNLWLYTSEKEVAQSFEHPYFPLLLGRSSDLASVNEIDELSVTFKNELRLLKGTIIPFSAQYNIAAPIQALPVYFSEEFPRRNIGTKPYYLLPSDYRWNNSIYANGFLDSDNDWEVFWQK